MAIDFSGLAPGFLVLLIFTYYLFAADKKRFFRIALLILVMAVFMGMELGFGFNLKCARYFSLFLFIVFFAALKVRLGIKHVFTEILRGFMKTGKRITASLLGQKTKRLFKNIIFSLIWLSVFFALLEFISISVIRGYYIKNSEHVAQYEYFIKTGKGFSQRNIASWTSHPFIPYVTEPNVYDKNGLMFNPYGYRSKTVPHENSIRVVCLGGSTTFGWSVKTEESWCYILERDLRRYFKRDDIDVINFGMPAAPSEISLALLHYRALALNPDLVIVLQGINDITHWAKDGKRRSDFSDFELRADWPEKKLLNPMLIFASRSKLFRLFLYIKSGSSSQIIPHFQGWYEGLRRVPDDENESGYETVSWEEIYTRNIKSMIRYLQDKRYRILPAGKYAKARTRRCVRKDQHDQ